MNHYFLRWRFYKKSPYVAKKQSRFSEKIKKIRIFWGLDVCDDSTPGTVFMRVVLPAVLVQK